MRRPLIPALRASLLLALLVAGSAALAVCQPPTSSLDWVYVGEIVQNVRTDRHSTSAVSGWSTVDSVGNFGASTVSATLGATYSESWLVTFGIHRFGLGSNTNSTRSHSVVVSVPSGYRARLMHQRREELRDLRWDVVCAWRNRVNGQSAITAYGFGYTGTKWRLYDAFDVRQERL
jgi:hypothetical protein